MKKLNGVLFGAVLAASGCVGGGGGGGEPGYAWVPCTEVEGEAPCCPRIDNLEDYCLDDETYDPPEERGSSGSCRLEDGGLAVSIGANDSYVSNVGSLRDDRLGWHGSMRCNEAGRVDAFIASDGTPTGCLAVCFMDEFCPDRPPCPERNPFPLTE